MKQSFHKPFRFWGLCNWIYCLFFSAGIWAVIYAQPQTNLPINESGLPFIQNFSPKDYGSAHAQNWAVVQDTRGIIYIANNLGILIYDGVSWRLVPTNSTARALAISENGRIFVGCRDDFGYLAPDSTGQLQFVSLLKELPEAYHNFGVVHGVKVTAEGTYFKAAQILFRWKKETTEVTGITENKDAPSVRGTVSVWSAQTRFIRLFSTHKGIYVNQPTFGLMKVEGDSLVMAAGGERFAQGSVYFMQDVPTHTESSGMRILAGSHAHGLFWYDGRVFEPFYLEDATAKELKVTGLRGSILLNDGTLAVRTRRFGLLIIDQNGRLRQKVNREAGLRSLNISGFFQDRENGLWLAQGSGVARVELPSRFSYFGEASGLLGSVLSISRHNGELYVAGSLGVFRLTTDISAKSEPLFKRFEGVLGSTWALLSIGKTLLIGGERAIYTISGDQVEKINSLMSRYFYRSTYHHDLVYVGLNGGLTILKKQNGEWLTRHVAGVTEQIRSIVEVNPGELWLGTGNKGGALHVRIPDLSNTESAELESPEILAEVKRYGSEHGLPGTRFTRVYPTGGKAIFATDTGLRSFNEEKQYFFPDSSYGAILADTTRIVSRFEEGADGKFWVKTTKDHRRETGVIIPQKDGSYLWDSKPFLRIADWGSVYCIYPDPLDEDIAWIGGPEGLVRYDQSIERDYDADFPALIRRVIADGDSIIFYGESSPAALTDGPILEYKDNALRFEYAAPTLDNPEENNYQVYLEGFDKTWSPWTTETKKDYTNLPEGNYTFRVRAKNIYDHPGSEAHFSFEILRPWYRSWWVYSIYGLLIFTFFWAIRRYEMGRQRFKHDAEIRAQEAEKLQEVDALKSRFFANISHEFRTPLTLIMGQTGNVLTKVQDPDMKSQLQMSMRNANRLLRLINQLLDLSKIEAGGMTLKASPQNIVPLLRSLTSSFESFARKKGIGLKFDCAHENIIVNCELDKIEKIIYNLLSNALKFTPEGGTVGVQLSVISKQLSVNSEQLSVNSEQLSVVSEQLSDLGGGNLESHLLVAVRDNGIGIPADRLPHIFDRFYQVDASQTREQEGTGIGLSLTKELVELHVGSISVESQEGVGSTFKIELPVLSEADYSSAILEEEAEASEREFAVETVYDDFASNSNPAAGLQGETAGEIILVVEDNADVRAYIRQNLVDDYRIVEAADGEDGFAKAQEFMPDLIISDVMMPKVDGYELARQIRSNELTSHIPIIMLTAKAAEAEKLEGLETGVDAYLVKPFSTQELQIRIRKLIEIRQALLAKVQEKPVISASKVMVTSVDQQFLERMQSIVEENIENENFQLEDLCREIGMSRSHLHRKLSALLGISPAHYIRRIRMERARQLLEDKAGNVSEIALQVGYASIATFSRAFRDTFGAPPSEFLKK